MINEEMVEEFSSVEQEQSTRRGERGILYGNWTLTEPLLLCSPLRVLYTTAAFIIRTRNMLPPPIPPCVQSCTAPHYYLFIKLQCTLQCCNHYHSLHYLIPPLNHPKTCYTATATILLTLSTTSERMSFLVLSLGWFWLAYFPVNFFFHFTHLFKVVKTC